MKILFIILLFLSIPLAVAQPPEQKSHKLNLEVITHDGKPENWLQHYVPNKQRQIPVQAQFNISHVRAALITDLNAAEKKCSGWQTKNIAYFEFDPALNLKQFKTRINKPCIHKGSARLKLSVATKADKRFYTIGTFKVHPDS
ncbi:MAG: hypothetical protein OEY52_13295, partial [Gammaproteobacteria bacterium]|nr:hypothetical protein [Gammaproteobacteria bacterium]